MFGHFLRGGDLRGMKLTCTLDRIRPAQWLMARNLSLTGVPDAKISPQGSGIRLWVK
jgi:hypothetical protein